MNILYISLWSLPNCCVVCQWQWGCLKDLPHSWPVAVQESNTSEFLYFHSFIYRFGTVARGLDEFTLLDETYDRTYSLCVLCVQRGTDIRKYHIAHLAFSEQERDFTPKVLYWSWKQSAGAASTQTHIQCRQRMAEIGDIQYWQGKHRKEKHIFLQGWRRLESCGVLTSTWENFVKLRKCRFQLSATVPNGTLVWLKVYEQCFSSGRM